MRCDIHFKCKNTVNRKQCVRVFKHYTKIEIDTLHFHTHREIKDQSSIVYDGKLLLCIPYVYVCREYHTFLHKHEAHIYTRNPKPYAITIKKHR